MFIRNFLKILVGAALSILLLVAFIPTIASSKWGQQKIEEYLSKSISGTASFNHLELSFLGPQNIDTLLINDSEGHSVLSLEKLTIDASLTELFFNGIAQSHFTIEGLSVDLSKTEKGSTNLQHVLSNDQSPLVLVGSPIYLHIASADVDLPTTSKPVAIKLAGATYQDELQGTFDIDLSFAGLDRDVLHRLAEGPELLISDNTQFTIDAEIVNFPTALLDWFLEMKDPGLSGIAEQTIGRHLNLTVHNDAVDPHAFAFEATSPHMNGNLVVHFAHDRIAVTKPGTARLTVAPQLLRHLIGPSLDIQLGAPTSLLVAIEEFHLPIDSESNTYDLANLSIKGRVDIREAILNSKSQFSTIMLEQFSAAIEASKDSPQLSLAITGQASQNEKPVKVGVRTWLDKTKRPSFRSPPPMKVDLEHIPLALVDELFGLGNLLEGYAGSYANLSVDAAVEKDTVEMLMQFSSDKLIAPSIRLKINQDIALVEPVAIEYKLDPSLFNLKNVPKQLLKLQFDMQPVIGFKQIKQLADLDISGTIRAEKFELREVALQDITMPWVFNAKSNKAQAEIYGTIFHEGQASGRIEASAAITNWLTENQIDLSHAFVAVKSELKQIPDTLVAALSRNPQLSELIGPFSSYSVDAQFAPESMAGDALVTFDGSGFSGGAKFDLGPTITLSAPFMMDIRLTPDRFSLLRSLIQHDTADTLALVDTAQISLLIERFSLDRKQAKIAFDVKAACDKLVLVDTFSGSNLTLESIQLSTHSADLFKKLNFEVAAKQKSTGQTSDFLAKGNVADLFLQDGSFNKNQHSLLLDVNIAALPLNLFFKTVCLDKGIQQRVEALFGSSLDIAIHSDLKQANGPIQATLSGPNGKVSLDARIETGTLFLNQPFQSEFKVTPALGNSILQDIFPLLGGVVSADQTFKILIDHKDFSFPLRNFDLSKINIGNGSLSLGHVKFNNEGQLAEILSLLTPQDADLITVWFTPLYFSMHHGELDLARIDMLISNHFPIAAWGNLNFPSDRIRMMIGLSGDAISYAFNVDVDSEYILQLPLKGSVANPSIDKSKATTKIGALVAHSQKSAKGSILGTVLDIASGSLSETKPPLPTTNPFPWEVQLHNSRQDRAENFKKASDEKPKKSKSAKSLEKAANKLLNKVFN